jgi:hypothetical protein
MIEIPALPHLVKVAFPAKAGEIGDRLASTVILDKLPQSFFDRRFLGRRPRGLHGFGQ